jgi:hypothetical protein
MLITKGDRQPTWYSHWACRIAVARQKRRRIGRCAALARTLFTVTACITVATYFNDVHRQEHRAGRGGEESNRAVMGVFQAVAQAVPPVLRVLNQPKYPDAICFTLAVLVPSGYFTRLPPLLLL